MKLLRTIRLDPSDTFVFERNGRVEQLHILPGVGMALLRCCRRGAEECRKSRG